MNNLEGLMVGLSSKIFFRFMCVFGDAQEHQMAEIKFLGFDICGRNKKAYEESLKKSLEYGLINRLYKTWSPNTDWYKLSDKGDMYIRDTAIKFGGSASYYRNFSRTPESAEKYG